MFVQFAVYKDRIVAVAPNYAEIRKKTAHIQLEPGGHDTLTIMGFLPESLAPLTTQEELMEILGEADAFKATHGAIVHRLNQHLRGDNNNAEWRTQ